MENKSLNIILLLGVVVGIGVCFWRIVSGNTTDNEALLLSLILTIISILGSWIVSSFYSEYTFSKSLRTFALKASEKVNNLSNELYRLSVYLQQELETNDYKSIEESLLARDIRIESAIHIINTLKSVNDGSLSDWQGVIGDELNAQKEKRKEKEEDIRKLIEQFELISSSNTNIDNFDDNTNELKNKVESLNNDIRILASQLGGIPIKRPKKVTPEHETIILSCPNCQALV